MSTITEYLNKMQELEEETELRTTISETGETSEVPTTEDEEEHKDAKIHEFVLPILGSALVFLIAFSLRDAISASFELLPINLPRVWTMWILVLLKLLLVIIIFVSLNFVGLTKVFPGC